MAGQVEGHTKETNEDGLENFGFVLYQLIFDHQRTS
jgi:hypothetical protein